ncbi:Unknown protein sequence [Pseudomonas syringae pv. maculicola]|nr:Unknown protein sequence [Pseudomonas syringae pv. maculicola]
MVAAFSRGTPLARLAGPSLLFLGGGPHLSSTVAMESPSLINAVPQRMVAFAVPITLARTTHT